MTTDEGFCFEAGDGVDGLREFLAHEHLAVPLFDLPARDRIQRGRAKRFARLEAEARVMERAPDRLADDEAVGEMATIVRAARTHREEAIRRLARSPLRRRRLFLRSPRHQ